MKICSLCKEEKSLEEFGKHKITKDGYRNKCLKCNNQESSSWHQRNPAKAKNYNLNRYYGIGLSEYNLMFAAQDGACAICKMHQSEQNHALSVDHNHDTGEIRGLLCNNCNRAVGLLKDNIETLQAAISYLSKKSSLRVVNE